MKVLIIGIVASGKTTLAKKLSNQNDIKCFEIDSIVHDDANNRKRTNIEQQKLLQEINKNKNWIIEGTLRKNLYNLLDIADKIIYLNIPLRIRKRRIFIRYIKQIFKFEKSNYKPSLTMLKKMYEWTNEFEINKQEFEKTLLKYDSKLEILDNTKKVTNYTL